MLFLSLVIDILRHPLQDIGFFFLARHDFLDESAPPPNFKNDATWLRINAQINANVMSACVLCISLF